MIKNCKCCGIDKKLDEFKKGRNQCIECIKAFYINNLKSYMFSE
jgi:hypothetical protein